MTKHAKVTPQPVKTKISIPGLGKVTIGPSTIPSQKGTQPKDKILKELKRAARQRLFKFPEHATI